jgi:hypothetical protein
MRGPFEYLFPLLRFAVCALFICLPCYAAAAQTVQQNPLPKVETIKNYPATGLMTGCGNLYFYKAGQQNSRAANYVFLSRGDGSHAWMNLNGRDVLLRRVKSAARGKQMSSRLSYRYGNVRITVDFEDLAPEDASGDGNTRMKITLRNGRAVRVVKAVGSSDC